MLIHNFVLLFNFNSIYEDDSYHHQQKELHSRLFFTEIMILLYFFTLFLFIILFALKYGSPILIPKAFASVERVMIQPSLFDKTTMGLLNSLGLNTLEDN